MWAPEINSYVPFLMVVSLTQVVSIYTCSDQYSTKDSKEPSADFWISPFLSLSLFPSLLSSFPPPCLTLLWYSALKTVAALASLDSLVHLFNSEKLLNFTCVLLFVLHPRNSLKTVGWNNCRAHLGCFPSPEDHCPVLISKTIVSHILYNFLIASGSRVNSTPVIPSWPETEVGLVNLLQFIYSAQDPTPRRFSYALPSSPPFQVVYPSLVSL